TRDEWCAIFDGTDACVAPILGLGEADEHPHNRARDLLVTDRQGKREPAPAPRLSRTPGDGTRPLPRVGEHTRAVLAEYGLPNAEPRRLAKAASPARPPPPRPPPPPPPARPPGPGRGPR